MEIKASSQTVVSAPFYALFRQKSWLIKHIKTALYDEKNKTYASAPYKRLN